MAQAARPIAISLSPEHEKQIAQIEQRIRKSGKPHTSRSEAVQIALLNLIEPAKIPVLIERNQKNDGRRRPS